MSQKTFVKVPFVWEDPKPLVEVPPRLTFEPVKAKYGDRKACKSFRTQK